MGMGFFRKVFSYILCSWENCIFENAFDIFLQQRTCILLILWESIFETMWFGIKET